MTEHIRSFLFWYDIRSFTFYIEIFQKPFPTYVGIALQTHTNVTVHESVEWSLHTIYLFKKGIEECTENFGTQLI